jgi:hypothetical protein
LEDKVERTQLGEATYYETQVDVETLKSSITMAVLELIELADEHNAILEEFA